MSATINLNDVPADVRRAMKLPKPRTTTFGKQAVRQHALRVLAAIASLTQAQRARVLQHALKVNRI